MLLQLFISFFKIGLFSFGGGYAALPLIQNEIVTNHHWLNISEFTDLITISQMTPGPIAVNGATFVGTKIAGISGGIVATLGCILPSCIIVTLLAYLYLKYRKLDMFQSVLKLLRPTVIAMIGAAGVSICMSCFNIGDSIANIYFFPIVLFSISCFVLIKYKANAIAVMVTCGILQMIYYAFVTLI